MKTILRKPSPQRLRLRRHLDHLKLALQPLLSVSTGQVHPAFPRSILAYHILTEEQLDDLAHWYHQRTPGPLSLRYPAPVIHRWDRCGGLEDKRRRFGRFIGLRGCDSPVLDTSFFWTHSNEPNKIVNKNNTTTASRLADEDMELADAQTAEEIERWVEARVRREIQRENEREVWRRKGF